MREPLLIEIGVEELPALPLLKILKNIESSWKSILKEHRLSTLFEFLYTPRRLVLLHSDIATKQDDSTIELFGPPLSSAFKDGQPTKSAEGFARKCGVSVDELSKATKGKREVLYYKEQKIGSDTKSLLDGMIKEWIASMSFGKMMRWGDRGDEFIRPIRWLQVRLGDTIVPVELFGVQSSSYTFVHRMVGFEPVEVESIESYEEVLSRGKVTLRATSRESEILAQFDAIESEYGITIERDRSLLAEIVAITENPKALLGGFDKSFLELPPEVIITSMKEHQRYFAIFEGDKLTNKFIVVSNAVTDDYTKVIEGNERVLKPRLADGMFFYQNDLDRGLSSEGLEKIQFMDGLGSLADKISRETTIALALLDRYSPDEELKPLMVRAMELAKADLTSEMVYEFTELQGLMGYYYAKALGEEPLVYNAIKEQYMPLGEGGELPTSIFSSIVAISIKLDTLMGLFSIGKIPTGSKDPFALRRAVNGIVRTVEEYGLSFEIDETIELLRDNYAPFDTTVLSEFMIERIKKSIKANPSVVVAVLSTGERDIDKILRKVKALDEITQTSLFKEQFATFKRVANISKDIDLSSELSIDESLFEIEVEGLLYDKYREIVSVEYSDYKSHLEALFGLKGLLDRYFDDVMVNVDDKSIRANRQNTIASIYRSFREIADIKEVTG